jgi:Fe2+ transport system protein B
VFAQELIELGRPVVVALNMVDLAERDGLVLDPKAIEKALRGAGDPDRSLCASAASTR